MSDSRSLRLTISILIAAIFALVIGEIVPAGPSRVAIALLVFPVVISVLNLISWRKP